METQPAEKTPAESKHRANSILSAMLGAVSIVPN